MIKIEHNIPLPARTKTNKYPWDEMKIGDSFFVEETNPYKIKKLAVSIASSASGQKPSKFTTRIVENGVRCWRIE